MDTNFDKKNFIEKFKYSCNKVQIKKFSKGETVMKNKMKNAKTSQSGKCCNRGGAQNCRGEQSGQNAQNCHGEQNGQGPQSQHIER